MNCPAGVKSLPSLNTRPERLNRVAPPEVSDAGTLSAVISVVRFQNCSSAVMVKASPSASCVTLTGSWPSIGWTGVTRASRW